MGGSWSRVPAGPQAGQATTGAMSASVRSREDAPRQSSSDPVLARRRRVGDPGAVRLAAAGSAEGTGIHRDDDRRDGLGHLAWSRAAHHAVPDPATLHQSADVRRGDRRPGHAGVRAAIHGAAPLAGTAAIRRDRGVAGRAGAGGVDEPMELAVLVLDAGRGDRWLSGDGPHVRPGVLGGAGLLLSPHGGVRDPARRCGRPFRRSLPVRRPP